MPFLPFNLPFLPPKASIFIQMHFLECWSKTRRWRQARGRLVGSSKLNAKLLRELGFYSWYVGGLAELEKDRIHWQSLMPGPPSLRPRWALNMAQKLFKLEVQRLVETSKQGHDWYVSPKIKRAHISIGKCVCRNVTAPFIVSETAVVFVQRQ